MDQDAVKSRLLTKRPLDHDSDDDSQKYDSDDDSQKYDSDDDSQKYDSDDDSQEYDSDDDSQKYDSDDDSQEYDSDDDSQEIASKRIKLSNKDNQHRPENLDLSHIASAVAINQSESHGDTGFHADYEDGSEQSTSQKIKVNEDGVQQEHEKGDLLFEKISAENIPDIEKRLLELKNDESVIIYPGISSNKLYSRIIITNKDILSDGKKVYSMKVFKKDKNKPEEFGNGYIKIYVSPKFGKVQIKITRSKLSESKTHVKGRYYGHREFSLENSKLYIAPLIQPIEIVDINKKDYSQVISSLNKKYKQHFVSKYVFITPDYTDQLNSLFEKLDYNETLVFINEASEYKRNKNKEVVITLIPEKKTRIFKVIATSLTGEKTILKKYTISFNADRTPLNIKSEKISISILGFHLYSSAGVS